MKNLTRYEAARREIREQKRNLQHLSISEGRRPVVHDRSTQPPPGSRVNRRHVQSVADSRPWRWCALSLLRLLSQQCAERGFLRLLHTSQGSSSSGMTNVRSTWLVENFFLRLCSFLLRQNDVYTMLNFLHPQFFNQLFNRRT